MKFAVACLLGLASAQIPAEVVTVGEPKDMQQCIDDIEGLIPGVEKVIADLKAGNQNKAILDLTLLMPKAEAAYKECTGSGNKELHHKIMKLQWSLKSSNPEDLPTCIADIEAIIPDLESVIADFKAGNYEKALQDGLTLLPEVEKAYTDCLAGDAKKFTVEEPQDMQQCIDDIEGLIPGVEKVIADLKAGNQNKAILDLTLLMPKAEAAYKECTGSGNKQAHHKFQKMKWALKSAKPEDLPTCIADIEAAIPDLEKVIADFKAGNYEQALEDGLAMLPDIEKAYTDCLSSKKPMEFKKHGNFGDLPTCIADLEAAIPDVEKIIADFKAGNYDQALSDALALLPEVEKAYSDCLSSAKPHIKHGLKRLRNFLSKINVGDLPTCIADIEAAIPDLEKVIADFKAGNYEQALTDGLAMLPDIEKAYTDCLSSAKQIGGRFKTILKDDPKREYFEKLGAEFASGFFAGVKVDHFDQIDLYECLHREPNAVHTFYQADEGMKYALYKHDGEKVVESLDELIHMLAEMVLDDYPHSHIEICKEFKDREAQWGDLKMVLQKLKDRETTLRYEEHKFMFNHKDITESLITIVEDYNKENWRMLGYSYASTLLNAAADEKFLQ